MVRVGLTTPKVRERVNHVFRFDGEKGGAGSERVLPDLG